MGARVREEFWLDDGKRWCRVGGLRALLGRDPGWEWEAEEDGVGAGWGVRWLSYHGLFSFPIFFSCFFLSLRG